MNNILRYKDIIYNKIMSKHKFKLDTFDKITNWTFNPIDRNYADKLIVGDIVRIAAKENNTSNYEKYYVEITKIDKYKYGGIYKPRKYYGKIIDVYSPDWIFLDAGDKITFRKENICEIPNWKSKNTIAQSNSDNIDLYIKRQNKINFIRGNEEYDKKKKMKLLNKPS